MEAQARHTSNLAPGMVVELKEAVNSPTIFFVSWLTESRVRGRLCTL